jgi:putative ABC transport system substrate-binding protein
MQFNRLKRREFITLLGGAAVAWPLAARAQQGERMRRVGVLMPQAGDLPRSRGFFEAFVQGLAALGWSEGRNLQIDVRWAGGDLALLRRQATELAAAKPDVILSSTNQAVAPLLQATRTLPIVFVSVIDPVGAGEVARLARPGGNATGFMLYEYSISGKWLELLKEIAPNITQIAVLRDPATAAGIGQFPAIQAVAPPFRVELVPVDVRDGGEIERGIAAFAREPNGGLIVPASVAGAIHRALIITLAAHHRLPAVYSAGDFVPDGGLISYGPNLAEQYRASAGYVDRILKGEKPADLPVQAPTKYELVINLKTAKALGLDIPTTVLARWILLQKSKVAGPRIFRENVNREEIADSCRFNRVTEVACEFGARRRGPSHIYTKAAPAALRNFDHLCKTTFATQSGVDRTLRGRRENGAPDPSATLGRLKSRSAAVSCRG